MKEEIYDDLFEEKEEKTNWQTTLFKYVIRWPWFIASIILCMACAWLCLKTITPVYNINASIIIKDDKKGGNSGGDLSAFENFGFISSAKNIDNEIEILRSKSLIKDACSDQLQLSKCCCDDCHRIYFRSVTSTGQIVDWCI